VHSPKLIVSVIAIAALAGCSREGEIGEGGIRVVRSACPAVAVPAFTGDITVFNPPQSRDQRALDVSATLTNLRSTCQETPDQLLASATFDVLARRSDPTGPREVVLPYFATVLRGGTKIVSKQIGRVAISFAPGEYRATTRAVASAAVSRAAATLPADVVEKITRKRKAGDADAAIDPMADPTTRAAVSAASFELLVGFQLTEAQLAYNATR
jgi:hypothetical protein